MKVLLINPSSSLIDNSWAYRKFFTPIAPLGLGYIASTLEQKGIEVLLLDQFATRTSNKELLDLIKKERPDIIGFSALTPVIPDIKRLVTGIREVSKESKVVLGNIHSSCFPQEVLEEGLADIVVKGEGEITMLELCQHLSERKELKDLLGISFKLDGEIIHNPNRELINDLDSLPFPAWHLLDLDNYVDVPLVGINKARAIPIIASRGCKYRCYYCSQDKVYSRVRYRDLNRVVDEMEYFNSKFNIKFFGFDDAYFPWDEESGLEFCNLFVKRGLHKKFRWCTETRVDKVSPRLLKAMKDAGIHFIMYGVEVGNDAILKSLNKGATLEQARAALKETRKAGILSQGLFMLGLPGETEKTCLDTINFAKELDCDVAKFNIATPYPGSRFFEDYKNTRTIHKVEKFTSWFDWTTQSGDLVYSPEQLDSQTLKYMQRKAMLEFYVRPKIILRHIFKRITSYRNIFYGGLWLASLFYLGNLSRFKALLSKRNKFKGN